MGHSLSWAALKGGNPETVCSALGLRATRKREQLPKSKVTGAALPTGWYAILFNRTEIKDQTLEKLSRAGEVVSCFVEDHVMFSSASAWKNGRQLWRVAHDGGQDGILHLETSGDLPAEFASIQKSFFAKQEKETTEPDDLKVDHVYELPAEVAKDLTAFRHDQDIPGIYGDIFAALEPKSGSLLSRLFGKKNKQ
jgi:hypothetical protein